MQVSTVEVPIKKQPGNLVVDDANNIQLVESSGVQEKVNIKDGELVENGIDEDMIRDLVKSSADRDDLVKEKTNLVVKNVYPIFVTHGIQEENTSLKKKDNVVVNNNQSTDIGFSSFIDLEGPLIDHATLEME